MDYIPGSFLRGDINVDGRSHLIFAADQMLDILCRAKRWYLDGTFKIVKEPFAQLISIHAFVKSESSIKQLPLVFVLMSGKRKSLSMESLSKSVSRSGASRMFLPLDTSSMEEDPTLGFAATIFE